jgi:tetratricopeptide (TPR) repeat protein
MPMRADRLLAAVIVALALVVVPPGSRAAADVAAADEAFDAGDNAKALALYDEILAADPGNVHALLRSGMLLSWDKRYDDALARYEKALTREPHDEDVLLERGKVLLWSRRYDEAIASFNQVLQGDPHQAWALCGTAQAYAWRGQSAKARPFYERALIIDPELKEARMGLAYVDLEDGDTSAALSLSTSLKATYPDDAEVAELDRAVRKARAPWVQIGYDHMDDSDENRMNTYLAEGGLSLPERMDLRFGYAHSDLHGPVPADADADGTADVLYGVLGWQPKPRQRGELRLGAARLTDSTGNERTTAVGGLAYTFPMATWNGRAAVAYDPFLYSPQILDNEIDITSVTFAAWGMSSAHVRIETDAGYGDFSDGNTRLNANAGAWYVWKWPKRTLLLGGAVRYLTFSEDLNDGYFDPSNLIAGVASLRSNGAIGSSKWEYESAVEVGTQSYTFQGAKTSGKPLWNLYGLVARPLPHGLSFQIYAGYGNSSTASGPGFDSLSYGARLRWTIGG